MARCRYCKTQVSYKAKSCPKCGEPNPGRLPAKPTTDSESAAYMLYSLIATLASLIAAYIGWKADGLWGAAVYWLAGGGAGIIFGWIVSTKISEEKAEKLNPILGLGLLAFILWLIFW